MNGSQLAYELSEDAHDSFSTGAPVLIAADCEAAQSSALQLVSAAGMRIGEPVDINRAVERLDRQVSTRAVWVELAEDGGGALSHLLERINDDANSGLYPAIVAAPARLLDLVSFYIDSPAVELLIDADLAERAAALAVATSRVSLPTGVAEVTGDNSTLRLRQLSEEVGRIAATLAQLSGSPAVERPAPASVSPHPELDLSLEDVRAIIRARRVRSKYFEGSLFADPAWDMLLDLTQAELAQYRVPVSSLCIAAAVPSTTALRWIKAMVTKGLFVRRADHRDARRVFIELSPATSAAMRAYFAEVGRPAGA